MVIGTDVGHGHHTCRSSRAHTLTNLQEPHPQFLAELALANKGPPQRLPWHFALELLLYFG
jgi:hypothetical protein